MSSSITAVVSGSRARRQQHDARFPFFPFPNLNYTTSAFPFKSSDLSAGIYTGTSPESWLNMQMKLDLWKALQGKPQNIKEFPRIGEM